MRNVSFGSDVRFAREDAEHITSLCDEGAKHHCAQALHHFGEADTSLFTNNQIYDIIIPKGGEKMQKESKTILTREGCKTDLKRLSKANLMHDSVLLAVLLLIFVPLFLLSIYLAKYILILGIVFALICTIFPFIFTCRIIRDVIFSRMIEQNRFSIVKDTVSRISRDEVPKGYSEGRRTVNVIYFSKYGRCVSPKVRTPFDLSAAGDEFYLVILNKNEEIIFAYNSIMCDL